MEANQSKDNRWTVFIPGGDLCTDAQIIESTDDENSNKPPESGFPNIQASGSSDFMKSNPPEFENHEIIRSVYMLEDGINMEASITVKAKLYFIETEQK